MEIVPLGDSALVVRVREEFEYAPEETLNEVLHAFDLLRSAAIPGVIELAPAYTSVAVFYDPLQVAKASGQPDRALDWLEDRVRCVVAAAADRGERRRTRRNIHSVEICVCYDPEFAPDLDHVAEHAKISPIDVVDVHSTAEYRVSCIGFVPGFPFLSGLPKKLATPRRATPRKEIPAGSVAIGGAQTGIYPLRSPGGWNVIGRTPLRLFSPENDPPAFLRVGDRVYFHSITREEFESLHR
jgi:inhibitor of KinA